MANSGGFWPKMVPKRWEFGAILEGNVEIHSGFYCGLRLAAVGLRGYAEMVSNDSIKILNDSPMILSKFSMILTVLSQCPQWPQTPTAGYL